MHGKKITHKELRMKQIAKSAKVLNLVTCKLNAWTKNILFMWISKKNTKIDKTLVK